MRRNGAYYFGTVVDMKIEYITGDLLQAQELCLVHGCNAQYAYSSGVAGLIRKKYPEAYKAYATADRLVLGEIIWWESDDRIIGNAITQQFYGRQPGRRYVSYDAIHQVIQKVNVRALTLLERASPVLRAGRFIDQRFQKVAFPRIGAGLAQGSWEIISQIIEAESTNFVPVVYSLE